MVHSAPLALRGHMNSPYERQIVRFRHYTLHRSEQRACDRVTTMITFADSFVSIGKKITEVVIFTDSLPNSYMQLSIGLKSGEREYITFVAPKHEGKLLMPEAGRKRHRTFMPGDTHAGLHRQVVLSVFDDPQLWLSFF